MAEVITFGCRLNLYESEIIKQNAIQANLSSNTFILNTCSVTLEAEKEAIKKIRKLKRENPDAKIIVTGCGAQISSAKFAKLEEVDLVLGNKEKMDPKNYNLLLKKDEEVVSHETSLTRHEDKVFFKERNEFSVNSEKIFVNDIMSIKETAEHMIENVVTNFESHTRAFVQIQNGCNHRCTFCIIPYARGNSRSVPFGKLVSEVRNLVENGYKEVVLTGVDITDYGKDLPGGLTLGKMSKRLLSLIPELKRLRFSSIDVAEVDREIYELISNEDRFMPYFHISLQSGDNLILKRMKRRHTREDVLEFAKKVRALRPDITLGADIITGFPTETEENFLNSKNLIAEAAISFCHIFSFSPHLGTPASKMPQVNREVIKYRTSVLIAEGKKQLERTMESMLNKVHVALCEKGNKVRCENFVSGVVDHGENSYENGSIATVKAVGIQNELLHFEFV